MRSIGIAENRKKKGLSQPELAELLSQQGIDVTAKAISKWETDSREPGLHVFLTLCKLLDIEDIYDAYFGKNPYSVMDGLLQTAEAGYLVTVWNRNTTTGKLHGFNKTTASAMERLVFSISMETPTSKSSMMNQMDYS